MFLPPSFGIVLWTVDCMVSLVDSLCSKLGCDLNLEDCVHIAAGVSELFCIAYTFFLECFSFGIALRLYT